MQIKSPHIKTKQPRLNGLILQKKKKKKKKNPTNYQPHQYAREYWYGIKSVI